MRMRKIPLLSLCVLTGYLLAGLPSLSHAVVGDMKVEFKDATGADVCPALTVNGTALTIAPSGGVFKCPNPNPIIEIRPKSSTAPGTARVEVIPTSPESANDTLRLTNALIKAITAVQDFHIIFTRVHQSGPDTKGSPVVDQWYKSDLYVRMSKVAGNEVRFLSTVINPISPTTEVQMGSETGVAAPNPCTVMCGPNYYTPFSTWTTTGQWPRPPELTQDRTLKVDLWFTLAAGSTLDLGNWMKIASSGNPQKKTSPAKITTMHKYDESASAYTFDGNEVVQVEAGSNRLK